jgi:hypothetical protein
MTAVPYGRWDRQGAGVLPALLAALLFAPSAARASCGDYVIGGTGDAAQVASPSLSSEARPGAPRAPAVPVQHGPCHGPFCSSNPLPAPLAPVPPAPVHGDQWACAPALLAVPTPEAAGPAPREESLRAVRHSAAIYHPPR